MNETELNRIEKRTIEILAVAPIVRAMSRRIGWDEAMAIVQEVHEREAHERGCAQARKAGPGGIDDLVEEVAGWGEGGVWEMKVLKQSATSYHFDVTRCPYHERYRELGLEEFGMAMSCCRDAPHARGFNPGLVLTRTTTLMEGGDRCDFRYELTADDSSDRTGAIPQHSR